MRRGLAALLRRGALALAVVLGAYAGTSVLAALFPIRPIPSPPVPDGGKAYVCTSIAHADIYLPAADNSIDWRAAFPDIAEWPLGEGVFLAFGWGDLRFFREVPEWADITLPLAFNALAGRNPTALRVTATGEPRPGGDCIRLPLTERGRLALAAHIRATADGSGGVVQPVAGLSHYELLYPATGRYGPFRTCNQWVAEALGAAGLPHARFAPFSFGVTWPLRGVAAVR